MTIRVLIADDHSIVLEGLRATLAGAPDLTIVAQARTGEEAVQRARQLLPDVVVMELELPGLGGDAALHGIRKASPKSRIVILSTRWRSTYIYRALRAGADGYLVKNAEVAEVATAIRAVHMGRRYLSQKITESIIEDVISGTELRVPLAKLTSRERQVLEFVVESKTSAEIAELLELSVKTVDTYRSRLMSKLDVRNVQELVKFAIRHGLASAG